MNEDYLWDKSGEPDPQVQQLEEVLGTLRYQPKPLKLPRELSVTRRRNYFPVLAIAATVVMAILAAGLWLRVEEEKMLPVTIPEMTLNATPVEHGYKPDSPKSVVVNSRKKHSLKSRREREEALAVKQQLMFALRLASEKLNLANKRTQAPASIKNQHRAG